jgi:hypothetical protein
VRMPRLISRSPCRAVLKASAIKLKRAKFQKQDDQLTPSLAGRLLVEAVHRGLKPANAGLRQAQLPGKTGAKAKPRAGRKRRRKKVLRHPRRINFAIVLQRPRIKPGPFCVQMIRSDDLLASR